MTQSSTVAALRMYWVAPCLHCVILDILARDQIYPPLAAGEIVTTGTLTRALPVSGGRHGRPNSRVSRLAVSVSASLELRDRDFGHRRLYAARLA